MSSGKLRVAGAWNGVLELELEEWTVPMLREEVAKRSGSGDSPATINLIASGKVLKDGDGTEKLAQLGLRNNCKVMATRLSADPGKLKQELLAEEERSKRLSRLKSAATSLSQRHADGSLPIEDFNLELENQSGETVQLGSATDRRAIMMGLMLHTNAKVLIRKRQYRDALEVLTMGEEAFSLCDPNTLEMVDNVSILQIDMVWCYFMLRDISWLTVAGVRLAKAREGLECAYGKEAVRVRLLQGNKYPELALHMRLELLEGVVAYHTGQIEKSRAALSAAQMKYLRLEVSDEALVSLMNMGYKESDAKRALRMTNQNVESAVGFLIDETNRKSEERKKDLQRQKEILEQKKYGVTPLKKAVDLQKLNELVFIGYEKALAAEVLRRNENDVEKSLDDLTDPTTNAAIQAELELKKAKRLRRTDEAIEDITRMGFTRAAAEEALQRFRTKEKALNYLLGRDKNGAQTAVEGGAGPAGNPANDAASSSTVADGAEDAAELQADVEAQDAILAADMQRDVEMEDEITAELYNRDPLSDYEIDVAKEGEAINEYLALISSAQN